MRRFRAANPDKTREAQRRHLEKHRDAISAKRKETYKKNRREIIAKVCEYAKNNRDKIAARISARKSQDPERARQLSRASYLRCRERDKERRSLRRSELAAYMRHKRNSDPAFAVADRLRRRINGLLKKHCATKAGGLCALSGCTVGQLVDHIERQFAPGMTWENKGLWHIDHIVPCSAFDLTDESQQAVAFHYTNLRPAWASDNQRKHAKIPDGQRRLFWSHADIGKAKQIVSRKSPTCTKVQ
jgi:hypothetical protein